jgi:hypothetical protein
VSGANEPLPGGSDDHFAGCEHCGVDPAELTIHPECPEMCRACRFCAGLYDREPVQLSAEEGDWLAQASVLRIRSQLVLLHGERDTTATELAHLRQIIRSAERVEQLARAELVETLRSLTACNTGLESEAP